MGYAIRKATATLAVAALSFTAAPYALAQDEEPTLAEPVSLVEPEAPATALVGPFCGSKPLVNPPAMPTEMPFLMSDGTTKTYPVKIIKNMGGDELTADEWQSWVQDPIPADKLWGLDRTSEGIKFEIVQPGDPADGKSSPWYYVRWNRLLAMQQTPVNETTTVGKAPKLPETVNVNFATDLQASGLPQARECADPTATGRKDVKVTWDAIPDGALDQPGTFELRGTITVDGKQWSRLGTNGAWGYPDGYSGDYGFDAVATVTVVNPPTTSTPAPTTSTETGTALPTTTESSTTAPVEPEETTTPAPGFDAGSLILPGLALGSMALGSSGSSNGSAQPAPAPTPNPAPNADPSKPAKGAQPAQQQPKRTGTLANTGANSTLTLAIASMLSVAGLTVLLAALRRRNT
ncbi:Ig-like domain-containing protein [Corynebacterium spheniscorum]|uniref:Ig-like domain (Group 4) n=1 Tax=Corynebacterium spheniscorum TaxID=185761 RepID=A0A1I2T0I0_9CORY|nr:Ig-like domain-containing protein [Corynebacterium spheniscorum]KAA8721202.1 hypothetical protein F4V56_05875 [Corynebacterium spheniscorum]SFG58524.1 Ig-like domain (group 4) [Corynebacterium spheniscorum]